jgi:dihydroorotate dehydrogenase (fumarate)
LEVNIALLPRSISETSQNVEDYLLRTIDKIAQNLTIPFSVKIGPYFTALPHLAERIMAAGAKGLVIFNRFYQFDIDIETLSPKAGIQFSAPSEFSTVLRWISILSGRAGMDLSATTGVYNAQTLIKLLLAGASTVQLASAIYKDGFGVVENILDDLVSWMSQKGYASLLDFQGALSQERSESPELYERLQYIKALTGYS